MLDILITQYKEDETILRRLLQSIDMQVGVDLLNDICVTIGNDGSDVTLSEDFLNGFSYPIEYKKFEHSDLAGCRKNLYDSTSGDYVMWCDADDMFFSSLGIRTILEYMGNGFDALCSEFIEEIIKNKKIYYHRRKNDHVFVHGKVYRRKFLDDNGVIWHKELGRHQDSCFNILAQTLAKDFKYCAVPFYLWKWRDDSICRKNNNHVQRTYNDMIDSNEMLVRDFLQRGMVNDAVKYSNKLVYDTYYSLNNPMWTAKENAKYRIATERRFARYYKTFSKLIESVTDNMRCEVAKSSMMLAANNGVAVVKYTFDDWLNHIKGLA